MVDKNSIRDDPATVYLKYLFEGHSKVRQLIHHEVTTVDGAMTVYQLADISYEMKRLNSLFSRIGTDVSIHFVAFEQVVKEKELILEALNRAQTLLENAIRCSKFPTPNLEALASELQLRFERFGSMLEVADLTHLKLQSHFISTWALVYSLVDNDDSKVPASFVSLTELRDGFFIEPYADGLAKYMAVAAELAEDLLPLFASLDNDARADHCARMKSHAEGAAVELEVHAMVDFLHSGKTVTHA